MVEQGMDKWIERRGPRDLIADGTMFLDDIICITKDARNNCYKKH